MKDILFLKSDDPDNMRQHTWLTGGLFLDSPIHMHRAGRPWGCVAEMQTAIIETWNQNVLPYDDVFVVGGLFNGMLADLEKILRVLNGTIHVVPSHRDRGWIMEDDSAPNVSMCSANGCKVKMLAPLTRLELADGGRWILSYHPLRVWEEQESGAHHAYSYRLDDEPVTSSGCVSIDNVYRALKKYRPLRIDEFVFMTGVFHVNLNQPQRLSWWQFKDAPVEYQMLAEDTDWFIHVPVGFLAMEHWPFGLEFAILRHRTETFMLTDGSTLIAVRLKK